MNRPAISARTFVCVAADMLGAPPALILSPARSPDLAEARGLAMAQARAHGHSVGVIARAFRRDAAVVRRAIKREALR